MLNSMLLKKIVTLSKIKLYFMEKNKGGRPHAFAHLTPDQLKQQVDAYFKRCDDNPLYKNDFIKSGDWAGKIVAIPIKRPYTIEGLCLSLGIVSDTFYSWMKEEKEKEFTDILRYAREKIRDQQIEGAMGGIYNANLTARLNNIKEQTEQSGEITVKKTKITFGKKSE